MRFRTVFLPAVAITAMTIGDAHVYAEVNFTFTRIADTNDGYSNFGVRPVRDGNWTAFEATMPNSDHVIVVSNGSQTTTYEAAPFESGYQIDPQLDLRNSTVYFLRRARDSQQIQKAANGSIQTLLDTASTSFGAFISTPVHFGSNDTLTFVAELDSGVKGVFRRMSDGSIVTIIDSTGAFASFDPSIRNLAPPAIGAALKGQLDKRGEAVAIANSDGAVSIVADTSGPFASFFGNVDVHNGAVTFVANLDEGGQAVVVGEDVLIDSRSQFTTFKSVRYASQTFLNLAFKATIDAGGQGLFYHDHTTATTYPIIKTGDALDGSSVNDVSTADDRASLGTICKVDLADGRSGIYLIDFVCGTGGQCLGDVAPACIGDNVIDVDDLIHIISSWGPCPAPEFPCSADLAPSAGNGTVDVDDLLVLINQWALCK